MARNRITWDDADFRRASSAYPEGEPASPAYQGQKDADAYDIGGPSEFAEDPHPGPYANGEHPATPDEGPASPAYKAAALERKAAKCIRIASAMLGEGATVAAVEDQALALMDLSDRAIQASLSRIAGEEEVEEEEEEEVEEAAKGKKAYRHLASRVARLERVLIRLAEEEGDDDDDDDDDAEEAAKGKKAYGMYMGDEMDEMALDEMLKEEGMYMDDDSMDEMALDEMLKEEGMDDDSMDEMALEEMLKEEGMYMDDDSMGEMASEHEMAAMGEMDAMGEMGAMGEMAMDPMGMMDEVVDEDEMVVLANLFGKNAADKKEEDAEEKAAETIQEEVEHKAEDKKEEGKKAGLRPQPKKASTGASRLGGVTKAASSEVSELSNLWESAPDVSKFF